MAMIISLRDDDNDDDGLRIISRDTFIVWYYCYMYY